MVTPTVSFVVPCYKLGHLLAECVGSVLSQTYTDWELLIMDDCSPDNTAEVAQSFQDPRVKHIRNEQNLGLVNNFNKGIGLSRGKYVWIISADDYLRRPYTLEQYVEFMEKHPQVGYTFCPAAKVENGQETEIQAGYGKNRIIAGHAFLKPLVRGNLILAPTAIVRRECYETMGVFPEVPVWAGEELDFSWAQDWYLWCLFALRFDVGYLAESLVCYRLHELSVTSMLTQSQNVGRCVTADIAVPWMIRQKADEYGLRNVSTYCLHGIAHAYATHLAAKQYRSSTSVMTIDEFEDSLCRSTNSQAERNWIRARTYVAMADMLFWHDDPAAARTLYVRGLRKDWRMPRAYLKLFLLALGPAGRFVRKLGLIFREKVLVPVARYIGSF
jgi:glycosyltransferase involved in cell wall biosynthesis